ncbi:MAG: NAD(P)-dependent oxidoreductase [Bacteroidota bacterium]
MKIGVIREGKNPPDARVPLVPQQCRYIAKHFPVDVVVEPSPKRIFDDEEYQVLNIPMQADISDCDVLMGVKEVPIAQLIADKTYFFFSHTIKAQAYNRDLLRAILEKNIRLIDYEVLTDDKGKRLIAFGRFAGMVGAHNGIWTYGKRSGAFELKRMKDYRDYAEAKLDYENLVLPPLKIVLTGTGRVGQGAAEVLKDMGIEKVRPKAFLNETYNHAVFTQLRVEDYAWRKDKKAFVRNDFYAQPELFESRFTPYAAVSDIFINGIYWDNAAPAFFTTADMQQNDFKIEVIADVTCDIAPVSSVPSTLRASTIADPVFGYDVKNGTETAAFQTDSVDMMAIDNLPNELARDASRSFGKQFIEHVLPELLKDQSDVIERATITKNGQLTEQYAYLQDFVDGK